MTGGSSYLVKSMKDYDTGTSAPVAAPPLMGLVLSKELGCCSGSFGVRRTQVQAPALPLLGSKTLNKVLTLAEPPRPPL